MAQLIGDTLGPYRILERLGVGGMAEVYKAYQPSMDRYVAIKVILQRFAQDATFLQRFQREARAVSRLEHPFILPVHDYGEAEGRPYLVMRYLAAGTLKNRLSGQPMPLRDVNRIIGQVGSALDYAHRTGVIHRDVKPSNVLMDAEGNAYLTDFGLAKMMEASVQLTGTGVGIGTPAYMSPEQGQGETVDSRTDVYSLGVMLYEMVTGRMPYQADTPLALVYKHVHVPLPLPRAILPSLPEAVERVILRAMAKDADDRFKTAGEMVHALDAAVRSAEGSRLAAPKPVAGAPQRRRTALWWVPLLLVLIAALLATWRPWTPPKTAAVETVVVEEVAATMPPSTPAGKQPSPEATATRGIVVAASATARPTNTPRPTDKPVPGATLPTTGDECPAYPPGFTFVADTKVYSVPDLVEPLPRQWFTDPTFGTFVVRVTDRANDLSPDDASPGMVNEYSRVQSFNADGSRLLAYGTEGTWYLYDAQTLLPLGELALEEEPRWDPDDPDVLYYSDETRLMSYNVQTASQTEVHDFADDFPGQNLVAVWTRHEGRPSRDGRYWGLLAQDQEWETVAFVVYDRQTDQVAIRDVRGLPRVEEGIDHVTISPLGNYFLASFDHYCEHGHLGDDANPCGLMVYDQDLTNGRSLLRIIGHYDPALDAQGREVIIYQDIDTDHISMLDLATGGVTPLWEIDFSYTAIGLHFSGLAFDRPGWAVVSTHDDDVATHTWMDDQVFLVELKPGGRVVHLAHTHSLVDESQPVEYYYWAEPHASANTDLTRVLFTTNWGRFDTGEVEMYMIALPADWPARLP